MKKRIKSYYENESILIKNHQRNLYYNEDIWKKYSHERRRKIINNYMKDRVKEYGGEIQSCYYCPHHPEKGIGDYKTECSCRKPEIGMLLEAQREMDIDKKNSFIVGDKVSDLKAGEKFGVTPILVKTGYGKKTLSKENILCETFENLKEFAENLKQKNGLKVK